MAEPENHTLHLLRELREDVQKIDRKIDSNHAELKEHIGNLTQALAGEMAANRYVNGGVERRLADIEKRLSALEHTP